MSADGKPPGERACSSLGCHVIQSLTHLNRKKATLVRARTGDRAECVYLCGLGICVSLTGGRDGRGLTLGWRAEWMGASLTATTLATHSSAPALAGSRRPRAWERCWAAPVGQVG